MENGHVFKDFVGRRPAPCSILVPMEEHEIDLPGPPAAALAAARRAAEAWGAELAVEGNGGRLRLPVVHGLRRGLLSGPLTVEAAPEGSRVVFRAEESIQSLQTAAVMVLLLAAAGGLLTVLWPFFPRLLPIAWVGAVLALVGWFLVISRLRTSGPQEFLAMVAAEVEDGGGTG